MALLSLRRALWTLGLPLLVTLSALSVSASAGEALYFSMKAAATLPATPFSLLVQSPSFINVPAGAVLTVHLMRGDTYVATSRLEFTKAYSNQSLFPSVPLATFLPMGDSSAAGQPLAGATLTAGNADLAAIAAAADQYRLLWMLSDGVMGTPGRAILSGAPPGFVNLTLAAVSAAARVGDQKPGSVLFYNRYTSNPTNTAREDTTLSLTNTNPAERGYVRLFLVSGSICQTVDFFICLDPRQTINILMSDLDPGTKGYCVAVAVDASGQPTQFNWLIGHAQVKQPSPINGTPYDAVMSAVAVAKRTSGSVAVANGAAEMAFDDATYDRLPAQIATDNIPTQVGSSNATTLIAYRPLANLTGGSVSGTIQFTGYNDTGGTSSASVPLACYREISVGALRFSPTAVSNLIPAGSTAWMAVSAADGLPLLGGQLNSGKFSGGSTARALAFTADYRITIPVKSFSCSAP